MHSCICFGASYCRLHQLYSMPCEEQNSISIRWNIAWRWCCMKEKSGCIMPLSFCLFMACVSTIVHLFWLIISNFSSVLIIFYQFFTWISLGDVDFCFSPMLIRTANASEEENKWSHIIISPM